MYIYIYMLIYHIYIHHIDISYTYIYIYIHIPSYTHCVWIPVAMDDQTFFPAPKFFGIGEILRFVKGVDLPQNRGYPGTPTIFVG